MLVSIIVAMYNEEESIPSLMKNLKWLNEESKDMWDYEFILVNDGSQDQTKLKIQETGTDWGTVRIIDHVQNQGFGSALRSGIETASGEIIVCYDADCTYPASDVITLVNKNLEGYDVASANPFQEDTVLKGVTFFRQILTRGNALLYRLAMGRRGRSIKIYSCAFRAYKAMVVKSLQFKSNGFGAASEILGRLLIAGASVVEVPSKLSVREFGTSKMNVKKAIKEHLKNCYVFWKIRWLNY
jgi:glycosyltransferase involved in cell wall biosynthesis